MKNLKVLLILGVFFLFPVGLTFSNDSLDQLQDMQNTGVTFDGSDGDRSGMDIDVSPTYGTIPEPPEPTPVEGYYGYSSDPEPVNYDDSNNNDYADSADTSDTSSDYSSDDSSDTSDTSSDYSNDDSSDSYSSDDSSDSGSSTEDTYTTGSENAD